MRSNTSFPRWRRLPRLESETGKRFGQTPSVNTGTAHVEPVESLSAACPRQAGPSIPQCAASGCNLATNPLIDWNLGASLAGVRHPLDAVVNRFANRLEEFNARIRQVLSHSWRNVKAFVQTIQDLPAQAGFMTDEFVRCLLVWILLAHWISFISIVRT